MIGVAVVLGLVGLVFPITMLLAALLFDVVVVLWVLFRVWHDDLTPKLARLATRQWTRLGGSLRPHRRVPRRAHYSYR